LPVDPHVRSRIQTGRGFSARNYSLSLQIVCQAGEEVMALRIGWAYGQATDWKQRRPPEPSTVKA
jgi:Asp-tRNA(Asn)/Glu-tRNA(Gln) amidotransferase A subunit family amidase